MFRVLPILLILMVPNSRSDERRDRNFDRAALQSLESSITKLKKTFDLRKLDADEREIFLVRLGELQIRRGEFYFRIDHGDSYYKKKTLSLERSIKAYREGIDTLSRILSNFPDSKKVPWAIFTRGKAYEEIGEKERAKADYIKFVERFPNDPRIDAAYMSLADFATEVEDHALAKKYLLEVEKLPGSPYFPIALHRLAWTEFSLRNIRSALRYLEKHIDSLKDRKEVEMAENVSGDVALFYLEGYESQPSEFTIEGALKEINQIFDSPLATKTYVRFARLLKAHGHLEALSKWSDIVYSKVGAGEEASEIATYLFDERFARRDWTQLKKVSDNLIRATDAASKGKVEKKLLETADEIQKLVLKNLASTEVRTLTKSLKIIYEAFLSVADKTGNKVAQAHYNLAEAFFRTNEYSEATDHYRMAVPTIKDAALKAVSSRHFELKKSNLIPEALSASATLPNKSVPSNLREWMNWVDEVGLDKHVPKEFESFAFDGARALYALGQLEEALRRLTTLAQYAKDGKIRFASAALVVDTYVASQDWGKVNTASELFLGQKEWVDTSFKEKLSTLASDSFFQLTLTESKKSSAEKLAASKQCIDKYPKGKHLSECAILAGKAAVELGQSDEAKKLLEKAGDNETALLLKASIQESEMDLDGAINSLLRSLVKKSDDGVTKQVLFLSWVSGDYRKLDFALRSPLVCKSKTPPKECQTYDLVQSIVTHKTVNRGQAFQMSVKGLAEHRSLWALLAIRSGLTDKNRALPFQDRIVLLHRLGENWKHLQPDIAMGIAKECHRSVFDLIPGIEKSIPQIAPLYANEDSLMKRVKLVQETERSMEKAAQVPFAQVKLRLLQSVAQISETFLSDVENLILKNPDLKGPLSDLAKPLQKKKESLHSKILESAPAPRVPEILLKAKPIPVSLVWSEVSQVGVQSLLYRASSDKDTERAAIHKALAWVEAGALAEGAQLLAEKMNSMDAGTRSIVAYIVMTRNWESVPREILMPFLNEIKASRSPSVDPGAQARILKAVEQSGMLMGEKS